MSRNRYELRVTTPVLGNHFLGRQFVFDPLRVGRFLVNFVDRNHDRHPRSASVLNGLLRLRHNAVISGHHQHNNIGRLGASRSHRGKSRMPGRIEEGDHPFVSLHVVGANVLRDTTGLTARYTRLTNVIEERRFTMIDMAHYSDHRSPGLRRSFLTRQRLLEALFQFLRALEDNPMPQFLHHQNGRILIEHLINRRHDTQIHQLLDHRSSLNRHLLRQVTDRNIFRNVDVVDNFFCGLLKPVLVRLVMQFFLTTATSAGNACLCGFQICNREVMSPLLAARARHPSSLKPALTGTATQFVSRWRATLLGRSSMEPLGFSVCLA